MDFDRLAKKAGVTKYGVSEKAPNFIYKAMEADDCEIMFARRDRSKWQVVVTLDFFKDMLDGFDYKRCPHCGEKIYDF